MIDGGVLIVHDSKIVIFNSVFINNMAHSRGGVLHLVNSDMNDKGSIFTGNTALIQDGGNRF